MAEDSTLLATKRYAVVTGANKGIGLEICRQLASKGIKVVLTARDESRGLEAVDKIKGFGEVVFHKLDVADSASIASLAAFVKSQIGKLDILVNNAGVIGIARDLDAIKASDINDGGSGVQSISDVKTIRTYEVAEECLKTNYYGAKNMIEAFIPLLQLSDSPRIVNVSSSLGNLKHIPNEWAKEVFSDEEKLTEERVDEVLNEFLKDLKQGSLEANQWPNFAAAYTLSKAGMNAFTRISAKKYPSLCINCVCPGYVKTDLNNNTGILSVQDGAEGPVELALLPTGSPSGLFFSRKAVSPF